MEQIQRSETLAHKTRTLGNSQKKAYNVMYTVYSFQNREGRVSTEKVSHNIRCDMQVSQNNHFFLSHCSWRVFSLTWVKWNTCRKICSTTTCPPHLTWSGLRWNTGLYGEMPVTNSLGHGMASFAKMYPFHNMKSHGKVENKHTTAIWT